jgi:hypothetical protein
MITERLLRRLGPAVALTICLVGPAAAELSVRAPAWVAEVVPGFRFNRVEEGQLSLQVSRDLPVGFHAAGEAGFSTGLERISATARLRRSHAWSAGTTFLEGDVHRGGGSHYGSSTWPTVLNTVQSLLGEDDYVDYYWNAGYAVVLGHDLTQWQGRVRLSWHDEDHESLGKTTDRDLLGRSEVLRPNPGVDEGRMRRVGLSLSVGGDYRPFDRGVNRRAEVIVERSSEWMGGDFDFTLLHGEADWSQPTVRTRAGERGHLELRITGGTHRGHLPVQRFGALDVSMGPVSNYGTLRAVSGHPYLGESYLALFAEQDFHGALLERVGLRVLADAGFSLGVHAAHGETWIDAERRAALPLVPRWTRTPHNEAGASLVLFDKVRLEGTRRFDPGEWSIGVGLTDTQWLTDRWPW